MTCVTGIAWTAPEHKAVRLAYASGGLAAAKAAVPHRTESAIYHKAKRLSVSRRRRWTREDDARLRDLWGHETLGVIAKKLGRRASAVYWRAGTLGLQRGAPQGTEYLTGAAKRTGFDEVQLRRILSWAGVSLRRIGTARKSMTGRRYHYVDPFDVDEAIAAWLATETYASAGRRYDAGSETMAAWLTEAGIPSRRSSNGEKAHHRVLSADVDRVMSLRRERVAKTETLGQAATRVVVSRHILGQWLEEGGLTRTGYHWRVDPADVDRIVAERRERPSCRARGPKGL